jgi:hypothetical protein
MRNGGLVLAFVFAMAAAAGSASGADRPSQRCDVGPLVKTFGKTDWLVYSCNNEKAEGNAMLVLVSAPGSPAMPFVFFYHIKDGGYRLYGEGTGDKKATRAAVDELQQLTEDDIANLIAQTRQIQPQEKHSGGKRSP